MINTFNKYENIYFIRSTRREEEVCVCVCVCVVCGVWCVCVCVFNIAYLISEWVWSRM